jgi:hypothetical protein
MNTYKVIFAKNEIISCDKVNEHLALSGQYRYEQDKGQLIYALIQADNEDEARSVADTIIKEVTDSIFGTDFITI